MRKLQFAAPLLFLWSCAVCHSQPADAEKPGMVAVVKTSQRAKRFNNLVFLFDGSRMVEGRSYRLVPRRVELKSGEVLTIDPKRLDASVKAMTPYFGPKTTFDMTLESRASRANLATFTPDYKKIVSFEMAVADLGLADTTNAVSNALAAVAVRILPVVKPSFEQAIVADLATPFWFRPRRSRLPPGMQNIIEVKRRDGSTRQVIIREPEAPPVLGASFHREPKRTAKVLIEIVETAPWERADLALFYFNHLHPGGNAPRVKKDTLDQFDASLGKTPREHSVAEMKRIASGS